MALGKKLLLLAALCGLAWGQTGLTTIQDTLFKADGTKFSGTLIITWSTFDAVNIGTIVHQSLSVAVVNGNLLLQLVPNATAQPPANVYAVRYESDGREQFSETWTVPVSTMPLTVAEVRTSSQSTTGGGGGAGGVTTIPESSVINLVADLAQRPIEGAGFGANAVAVVDQNGQLETAVGDPGECVFVDGTTGPCGQPTFSDAETPGGTLDGVNGTFTLANTPLGSSLMLFRNGVNTSASLDYTLTGSSIQFASNAIPQPGDILMASYRVNTSAGGNIGGLTSPSGGTIATAGVQVICNAAGASTTSTAWTSLGACDIPASGLLSGDRIEVRFTFAHTGAACAFNFQLNWGNTTILARTGSAQDAAVVGSADAAITAAGAQISTQSWGTVLPFLPGIFSAPAQAGLEVVLRAALSSVGPDSVKLTNYTVLRYPGN